MGKKPVIKPGDFHIIVNDRESSFESEMSIYDSSGKLVHRLPCLAKGQTANYRIPKGDTPPGLYRCGQITQTRKGEPWHIWRSFGEYFIDMVGLEQNEEKFNRAGCGIHGGGSGLPDPLAPYQELVPTHGCIRVRNKDLEDILVPMCRQSGTNKNTVYLTVNQY
jgi:L,D-transpeptidase catalytic domain